jgi:RNA polymerase sigma factor (sigma-70 family)
MVRNRARRLLGNEVLAQDAAQEAFVKLLEYRKTSDAERNTPAFLYRTVTNLALNRLRDSKRRREIMEEQGAPGAGTTADGEITDRIALRKVLGLVAAEDAEIGAYYYVDGMEHEEIAAMLGLPRRTVGRRLERFCKHARELLAPQPEVGHG